MTDQPTDLINDEGVCRTAPATPGLLKRYSERETVESWRKRCLAHKDHRNCWKTFEQTLVKYDSFNRSTINVRV